ncbi:hypothetical protein P5663_10130 [Priestia flexa]|uniref:hypothetical protein n=1 Tax=Priestia flexa TaxID=86664 RepID=UPI00240D7213|nr:hypothetical protein [Priestia flexa]WEZ10161.1 hypothetical protein P5663_10130 [Priestia flexa]
MNYEQLKEYLISNDAETQTFLPNEIFEELKIIENVQHRAFAYAYIYLNTYLWRYAKYGDIPYKDLTQEKIKEILGRKGDNRLNYLIKKDGLLEQMKWLETTNDFPTITEWKEEYKHTLENGKDRYIGYLEFTMLSDWIGNPFWEDIKPPNKFTVKKPIRCTYRYPNDQDMIEEYDDGYEDGTFHFVDNTHRVPIEVFIYCMSKKEVGIKGFYMYSYLFAKNQCFGAYDRTLVALSQDLAIPEKTIDRYLDIVKKFNMVKALHNQKFFVVGMKKEDRKANTYITQNIDAFTDTPIDYKKIEIKPRQEYLEELKQEEEKLKKEEFAKRGQDIPLEQLPF